MSDRMIVRGLGTAVPAHRVEQAAVASRLRMLLEGRPEAARQARALCRRTGVRTRYSCLSDFSPEHGGVPFGAKAPGTAARMQAFRNHAPPLAAEACRRALARADLAESEVSHLVAVTSTGFFSPGLDVALAGELGLAAGLERMNVGFMGCEGFQASLRIARAIARAERRARILVACVELPSLHFRVDASFENLVACALFGDGAGAFVVAREGEGDALAVLAEGIAEMQLDATIRAGWEIGDDGVAFVLPPAGVAPFRADLSTALAPLLGEGASSELAWSVHPADPITLRHVQQGLGLSTDAMAPAFEVLASFGNVVSAGSVFVLERCLARAEPGTRGVLLGVRPGLSVHAMGYTVGARWHD